MVVRYPDPNIKTLDPRFSPLVLGNAAIETIAMGCRFTEGPVWFGDLRCLLSSQSIYSLYVEAQGALGG